MDAPRFDRLTRSLTDASSRRGLLRGFMAALGLAALGVPRSAEAKKRKNKQKIKRNCFGCVNAGSFCKNAGQCCSGICKGKKGKKGKKKCQAHDASTCVVGQTIDQCGGVEVPCTASGGESGFCTTTTGNAAYCATSGGCFPCKKDVDCEPVCGPGAACIACGEDCADVGGTLCAGAGGVTCNTA